MRGRIWEKRSGRTWTRVGKFIVFNIGGNKYRVVVNIYYYDGVVLIRHVLTHAEYNKGQTDGIMMPRYGALIEELPLLPICSEKELDRAIAMIDSLSDREKLAPEERGYMLVLASLIERYEEEHHPMPPISGAEMLRYLIDLKGIGQADLAKATGIAKSTLSEILTGKRSLSVRPIRALAEFFGVSPAVLISD